MAPLWGHSYCPGDIAPSWGHGTLLGTWHSSGDMALCWGHSHCPGDMAPSWGCGTPLGTWPSSWGHGTLLVTRHPVGDTARCWGRPRDPRRTGQPCGVQHPSPAAGGVSRPPPPPNLPTSPRGARPSRERGGDAKGAAGPGPVPALLGVPGRGGGGSARTWPGRAIPNRPAPPPARPLARPSPSRAPIGPAALHKQRPAPAGGPARRPDWRGGGTRGRGGHGQAPPSEARPLPNKERGGASPFMRAGGGAVPPPGSAHARGARAAGAGAGSRGAAQAGGCGSTGPVRLGKARYGSVRVVRVGVTLPGLAWGGRGRWGAWVRVGAEIPVQPPRVPSFPPPRRLLSRCCGPACSRARPRVCCAGEGVTGAAFGPCSPPSAPPAGALHHPTVPMVGEGGRPRQHRLPHGMGSPAPRRAPAAGPRGSCPGKLG